MQLVELVDKRSGTVRVYYLGTVFSRSYYAHHGACVTLSVLPLQCVTLFIVAKRYIGLQQVSEPEQVNRKCHPGDTTVQLSTIH